MKKLILIPLLLVSIAACAQSLVQENLKKHVYYMAADSLQGRLAGSAEGYQVSQYLKQQYQEMGLVPYFNQFESPFTKREQKMQNIVGVIEGSDSELKNEYIVIGAHYDHIGLKDGKVCNGADDNASGSAVLVEMARKLLSIDRSLLKRSVIIAAFDGEEQGLWGSGYLVSQLWKQNKKVVMMMSIDMVGWYGVSHELILEGTGTLNGLSPEMDNLASKYNLKLNKKKFESSIFTATDTEPFAKSGMATLAVTTGTKSPYHKPEDDAELIDYEGMERICGFLTELIAHCAAGKEVKPSGKIASIHSGKTKAVEFGLWAGWNSSSFEYQDAYFQMNRRGGMDLGANLQFNTRNGKWSLSVSPGFAYSRMYLFNMEDPVTSSISHTRASVFVPVNIRWNILSSPFAIYLFAGGNYRYSFLESGVSGDVFKHGNEIPSQWGWDFGYGIRFGRFYLEDELRFGISKMFQEGSTGTLPGKMSQVVLKFGYMF